MLQIKNVSKDYNNPAKKGYKVLLSNDNFEKELCEFIATKVENISQNIALLKKAKELDYNKTVLLEDSHNYYLINN